MTENPQILSGPRTEDLDLVRVLAALADPVRLKIAQTIHAYGETPCGRAAELAGVQVTKSTLSHHVKTMRESGLIHVRVEGRERWFWLRREDLEERFPGLLDAVLGAGDRLSPGPVAHPA